MDTHKGSHVLWAQRGRFCFDIFYVVGGSGIALLLCLARSHLKSHMHLGGARLKKDHKSRKIKDLKRLGREGASEHEDIFLSQRLSSDT